MGNQQKLNNIRFYLRQAESSGLAPLPTGGGHNDSRQFFKNDGLSSGRKLDPEWIAGLVDAEGYFSIHIRNKIKNQWGFTFGIRMNIREMYLLECLKEYFKIGYIRIKIIPQDMW